MTADENSIVDYLEGQGFQGDMASRKLIAEKHGIVPYSGTAEQNVRLLKLLKNPPRTFWQEIKALLRAGD